MPEMKYYYINNILFNWIFLKVMSRIEKRDNNDKDQDKVNVPRKENN